MKESFATPKSMKTVILRGIRTSLLELGSATKAELSKKLGISFPTVSKFLAQMEKEGELASVGLDDSSGGRRARRYAYDPEHMLGLSIFLEKDETNYTVFNCLGEVKAEGKMSSVLDDNLPLLTNYIEDIIANYPRIRSIAIGVPGAVDNGRIFYIPGYEHYQHVNLKEYYEELFSIPVVVENDMNAAVLGYHNHKGKKDKQSLVYLYSGQNGPGAGIMINGDVVRGSTFFSGEVSFLPLYDEQNFLQGMKSGNDKDAISRLIASFVAIINPHTFIFCKNDVNESKIEQIAIGCEKYIPAEHLPQITISDWEQDYLFGLQSLGLDLMLSATNG